jgi:hypothetical protein
MTAACRDLLADPGTLQRPGAVLTRRQVIADIGGPLPDIAGRMGFHHLQAVLRLLRLCHLVPYKLVHHTGSPRLYLLVRICQELRYGNESHNSVTGLPAP